MLILISPGRTGLLRPSIVVFTLILAVCLWTCPRRTGFQGLDSLEAPYAIEASLGARYEVTTEPGHIKVYLLDGDIHIRARSDAPAIDVFVFGDHLVVEEGEYFITTSQGQLLVRSRVPQKTEDPVLATLGMHE